MSTAFLDISRQTSGYRPERTNDYFEVEQRLDSDTIRKQASRCMNCGIAFCHGYGCPLGNDIPSFNNAVAEGRLQDAYTILNATSPFPEFTSHVCPALCEAACCAGIHNGAVTIRHIEQEIIEQAFARGYAYEFVKPVRTGRRVAVIGSGPAGLAAAHDLNALGHEVVVFEKNRTCGGLLRYGIPDFKLGKPVIDRRLALMEATGIFFETGIEIGVDVAADYLRRKFNAVCLCIGSERPRNLDIPGRHLRGVHFAMEFLAAQNRVHSGEIPQTPISAAGRNVLIIGGGDTGSDCLGTALRQGATSVTQVEIMPEPPVERAPATPWPEWPCQRRTSSSHLEGGQRIWSTSILALEGWDGAVKRAVTAPCRWDYTPGGRPIRPVTDTTAVSKIEADLVLLAMGFTGVEHHGVVKDFGVALTECGRIAIDAAGATSVPGVFACGDAATGPSLVVRAAASGKNIAGCIDGHLKTLVRE